MQATTPRIAIVGRPNVGKSTLANRMCGSRVSIVEPTEGVTRDRVAVRARLRTERGERSIEVIDTGGIGVVDRDDLGPHVEEQVRAALLVADVVLFVVDARSGMTPLDRMVADRLRGFKVPVVLVANKAEGDRNRWEVDSFRRFGLGGDPFAISAQNGEGLTLLYEHIDDLLPGESEENLVLPPPALKVAIVGRRNAGKSTLVNYLAREDRCIVSEIPGTTRDAIDVLIERDGTSFTLIDTAGVRKKKSMSDAVEFYSDSRSHKAIRRADVVILMFDVKEPLSGLEKRLAKYVVDHHKPVVLGANKWDTTDTGVEPEDFRSYLYNEMPGLIFAPVCFISAKSGFQVAEMFAVAVDLHKQAQRRVSTGELNRVLGRALEARAPSRLGHRVRLLYATQAESCPPTFVLFVNDKRLISKAYLRYLENRIREDLPFPEVPVQIILRDRKTEPEADF